MKIAISGATGFIGTHLTRYLSGQGHEVTGLGRKWFGRGNADHLAKLMEGMDVVINLAGAPVNHRGRRHINRNCTIAGSFLHVCWSMRLTGLTGFGFLFRLRR